MQTFLSGRSMNSLFYYQFQYARGGVSPLHLLPQNTLEIHHVFEFYKGPTVVNCISIKGHGFSKEGGTQYVRAQHALNHHVYTVELAQQGIESPDDQFTISCPNIICPNILSPNIICPNIFCLDIFCLDIFCLNIFCPNIFQPIYFSRIYFARIHFVLSPMCHV